MNKDYVRTTSRPPRKRKPTGRSGSAQPTRAPFPVIRAVLAVALVIGFGVFLYLLKGQEWFDPALAEKFERKFNNAVTAANVERLLKFSRGPVSMRQRYRTV